MPTLSSQAQAVISAFGRKPGVTADQLANLQSVINGSPALVDQINQAVAAGHLRQITVLPHTNAGGEYDGNNKEMRLPLSVLTTPAKGMGRFDAGEVTFVLGHELQHGFNHAEYRQANVDFHRDAAQVARGANHDYIAPVGDFIAASRRNEAGAEIAGWNAIVASVQTVNPNPTLRDIYNAQPGRMSDFIDVSADRSTYTLKPNLTLNQDMTLGATPGNIEAMGQNYFDKPARSPGGLGHHGNSDYANYYGAFAVGVVAELHRKQNPLPPGATEQPITLNMVQLRLSERLMEENGINLHSDTRPMPYLDSSTNPPTQHLFQHTIGTHTHVNPVAARAFEDELASGDVQEAGRRFADPAQPSHPDHALHQQIRVGVQRLDGEHGRSWDETSERLNASLLVLAKEKGLTQVDHVLLSEHNEYVQKGENIFLVQGGLDDPAHRRADMKTQDAIGMTEAQSHERLEQLNQRQPQEADMGQQQQEAPKRQAASV